LEAGDLAALDAQASPPIRALNYDRPPPVASHASPHAFVCSDGRTYWIKRTAQHGLIAELVAGRLGAQVDAAPIAHPVEVAAEALPASGAANHLEGLGVGVADQPSMENFRHISEKAPDGNLDPARLQPGSVARVVAFQSWIGADDTQILVDLRTGKLFSIDHGALAAIASPGGSPQVVVAPGIPADIGRVSALMLPTIERIEAITDEDLLRAVAGAPDDPIWCTLDEGRLAIAESLRLRRDALRQVLTQWLQ
jgi:hypothetical protein